MRLIKQLLFIIVVQFLYGVIVFYLGSISFKRPMIVDTSRVDEETKVTTNLYNLFECVAWRCPEFESVEIDGDYDTRETLVYIPIGLTKEAGRFLFIQKGKLIFDTPALANLNIDIPESGDYPNNRIVFTYWDSWEDLKNPVRAEAEFKFKDGNFVQIKGHPMGGESL